jgi:2-methylisocitrate lyase-like PEP mutase family enzyme
LQKLKDLVAGNELIVAPLALNPLMARMAEEAGFKAVYLSGGSLGWVKCVTEANLTLPELAEVAVDMRAVCKLPIVLDAGGGWGDPVHIHRTIALAEAAGFQAIELEDQLLPRRMEHHVGIDHLVPNEFFLKKLREALAARTDPNLVIIARTNALRVGGIEEAVRRGETYRKAGADLVFCYTRSAEELRFVAERIAPPLMMFAPPDGFSTFELSQRDLAEMGYRLAASSGTALAAMYKAIRQSYACLANNTLDPFLGRGGVEPMMKAAQKSSGFDKLLEIERRTMGIERRSGSL